MTLRECKDLVREVGLYTAIHELSFCDTEESLRNLEEAIYRVLDQIDIDLLSRATRKGTR